MRENTLQAAAAHSRRRERTPGRGGGGCRCHWSSEPLTLEKRDSRLRMTKAAGMLERDRVREKICSA